MTISKFVDILLECCAATYHLEAEKEPCEYIVWREVGTRGLRSDNQRTEEAQRIAVDLFTKKEFSEIPDKMQKNLTNMRLRTAALKSYPNRKCLSECSHTQ